MKYSDQLKLQKLFLTKSPNSQIFAEAATQYTTEEGGGFLADPMVLLNSNKCIIPSSDLHINCEI